jgi:maleate isomerase
VHTARMRFPKAISLEAHYEMEKDSVKAAEDLVTAGVDLIVYGCTSGSFFMGKKGERETARKLQEASGLPVITTSMAIVEALSALRANKLVIATPYPKFLDEKEKTFFEAFGLKVLRIEGMGISDAIELGYQVPEQSYRLARQIFVPEADAILISCMNLRSIEILAQLERDVARPVVSSVQSSMWLALRAMGVGDMVKGYGRLLEDPALRMPFNFWKDQQEELESVAPSSGVVASGNSN